MNNKKLPTMRDVAQVAGVAPITVSRVINNTGYVNEETRQRVEAAIHALSYVPNSLSQSLRHRRTNTIALVLSDITNPFWTTVTRGVEDASSEQALNLFLCNTDEKTAKLENYIDVLLQRQTDGFLLVPADDAVSRSLIEKIQQRRTPLVVLDRPVSGAAVDVVRSDSEGGAYKMTAYLIAQGHRKIAIIPGPEAIVTSQLRLAGYKRAMQDYQVTLDPALIRFGQYNQQAGYNMQITQELMADTANRPTAIFAGNDFIALGVLQALGRMKVNIPDEVSVVSFDDVPLGWHIEPFLTVIAQSPYHMGYEAASLLMRFITGEAAPDHRELLLPVELIERQSVKRLG